MKVFVAGHRGMVGQSIVRQLNELDITPVTRMRSELDLTNQKEVANFFEEFSFDAVYLAAAKVGGIGANSQYPADFIYENLAIQLNVIHQAFLSGVKRLLFLGSSCIYPRDTEQPISEGQLLSGKLESTNEPYAIAKIAGIKLCESYNRQFGESHGIDYRSVMPTNLYGVGDNYHPQNSHVLPALIRRIHIAKVTNQKSVTIWGTGNPRREFLYVDDMASACVHVMNLSKEKYQTFTSPMQNFLNVGTGVDIKIIDLARLVARILMFEGEILTDATKPDGTPRKLLDTSKINATGWIPKVSLEDGISNAYVDFLNNAGAEHA